MSGEKDTDVYPVAWLYGYEPDYSTYEDYDDESSNSGRVSIVDLYYGDDGELVPIEDNAERYENDHSVDFDPSDDPDE